MEYELKYYYRVKLTLVLTRKSFLNEPQARQNPVHISAFLTDARSRGVVKGEISSP